MQDFVSSQMIVRVQLSRIGCLGSGFSQQFASRRAQGSYSCGVWLGFKTLVELEVKHQVSWLHKLTHYVSFCFLGSILIEEPPRCMYHMEDLRCKDLCKNHVKLTLSSLWFLHVSPRCSQFKGLSAESPIAPFVSPTYFSSLDVHVKIYAKMFEGCVCFTVRGAFLVSEAGGELRNCGTDQNSPFFCSCVKFGQIRFSFAWAISGDFESLGCTLSVVCHKPMFLFVVSVSDRLWFSLKSFIALQLFSVSSDNIWSNCSDTRLSQILVDSLLLSKLIVYYQAAGVDVFSCYWVCAQISQYKVFNYVLWANFPNLRFFPFLFQLQE